jgi:hypothetical protein
MLDELLRYDLVADGKVLFVEDLLEAEVGGFFKLAEPLVGRAARRQTETDMATLKDLLEAGAPDGM